MATDQPSQDEIEAVARALEAEIAQPKYTTLDTVPGRDAAYAALKGLARAAIAELDRLRSAPASDKCLSDREAPSDEHSTAARLRALLAAAPVGPFHWQKSDLAGKDITLKREHWTLGSVTTLTGLGLIFGATPTLAQLIVEALNALPELLADIEDYDALFDLQWEATVRGVALWREKNPGNDLVLPDHADLTAFLLAELDAARATSDAGHSQEPTPDPVVMRADQASRFTVSHASMDALRVFAQEGRALAFKPDGLQDALEFRTFGYDLIMAMADEIERLRLVEEDHRQAGEIIIDLKQELESQKGERSDAIQF